MTSEELRQAREYFAATQKRFAEMLCVSTNTVARWERGERAIPPMVAELVRLLREERECPHNWL